MITALLIAAAPITIAEANRERMPIPTFESSAGLDLEVVISPKGEVQRCRMMSSAGEATHGPLGCAVLARTPWKAAKDEEGEPIYGMVRFPLKLLEEVGPHWDLVRKWQIPADAELEVQDLPRTKERTDISVGVMVDAEGQATGCEPQALDYKAKVFGKNVKAYGKAACDVAITLPHEKISDPGGKSVPYVRAVRVLFVSELAGD